MQWHHPQNVWRDRTCRFPVQWEILTHCLQIFWLCLFCFLWYTSLFSTEGVAGRTGWEPKNICIHSNATTATSQKSLPALVLCRGSRFYEIVSSEKFWCVFFFQPELHAQSVSLLRFFRQYLSQCNNTLTNKSTRTSSLVAGAHAQDAYSEEHVTETLILLPLTNLQRSHSPVYSYCSECDLKGCS